MTVIPPDPRSGHEVSARTPRRTPRAVEGPTGPLRGFLQRELTRRFPRSAFSRYALAVALTLTALGLSMAFNVNAMHTIYIFFFGAIAVSAFYGGLGPGLLATGLALILSKFFLLPPFDAFGPLTRSDELSIIVFLVVAIFMSTASGSLHSARGRAERQASELEQALQDAEGAARQVSAVIDGVTDVVVVFDLQWRLTHLNPAAAAWLRRLGMDPDALLGRALWDALPAMRDTRFEREARRAVAERRPVDVEEQLPFDGRWYETRFVPTAHGVAAFSRDVTEEHEGRRFAAQLAAIVASSDDPIIGKTLDGTILSWNDAATRVFGWTADEAIGRSIRMLVPPELQDEETMILERLRRGEGIDHYETARLRKDGTRLTVSLSVSPIRDETGHVVSAAKIARDVTRQRRNERRQRFLADATQALASSLDFERVVATLGRLCVPGLAESCVVDIFEESGVVRRALARHADPEKQRLLDEITRRYPPDASRPLLAQSVISTERGVVVPTVAPEQLAAAARDSEHAALIARFGVISYLGAPLKARGTMLGVLFLFSGAHHFDEDDLALVEELSHRAALALDNARLYREAQIASLSKSEFLATMSHELRTPLTAILGYQELLADGITGPVTPPQQHQLRRIKTSAMHLLNLIDEVLSFARLDARREVVRVDWLDAGEVVHEAADIVEPLATDKQLTLAVHVPSGPVRLRTDGPKLRQILLNLLSNAVKFTERGEVSLTVRQDGSDVLFDVTDTGIGIAPAHLERIFDAFWQVEQSATRRAGGTGLGLSVSRQLARLLGGDLSVESAVGQGSTFTVRLPVVAAVEGAAEPASSMAPPSRARHSAPEARA